MGGPDNADVDGIKVTLKGVARVAVANIAVVIILLSAIEGYFRVATADQSFFLFSEPRMRLDGRAFVTPHPSRGFVLLPGYEDDDIQIDERGFRAGPQGGSGEPGAEFTGPAAPTGIVSCWRATS